MKKERLASFKKRLLEKQQQLADDVGTHRAVRRRTRKTTPSRTSGDQANTAYTREFFFELGNGDRRLLRDVVAALPEDRRWLLRQLRAVRRADRRQAARGAALRALLHRLPAARRSRRSARPPGDAAAPPRSAPPRRMTRPPCSSTRAHARPLARAAAAGGARRRGRSQGRRADARAREARQAGHVDEARTLYRYVLQRWPHHADGLRGLRDLAIDARDWDEAVAIQQRLLTVAAPADRAVESEWLAVGYYELGRLELARGDATAAAAHFRARPARRP